MCGEGVVVFQLSGYTLLYLVATCVSAVAAVLAFRIRREPGGGWLFLLTLSTTMWALSDGFDYSVVTIPAHVVSAQFAYLGSAAPVLFLLFALRYSGRVRGPMGSRTAWLFAVPFVSLAAAFSNQYHHLLWTGFAQLAGRPNIVLFEHGPVYWLVTLYSLALALVATFLLVDTAIRSRGVHRAQSAVMAAAAMLPMAAGVAYSVAPASLAGFDPSLTFTVAAAVFAWTMWRLKLLDLALVPREVLVEEMTDGLIVLDSAARILEINPAAVRLLGLSETPDPGTSAVDAFRAWSSPGDEPVVLIRGQRETTLTSPAGASLSVERSRLAGHGDGRFRDLLVVRDVTARIDAQRELLVAYDDLQARMGEIEGLHAELREQATRDPLTGLHNRRYLVEELGRELTRAGREGYPVSIVMFDVDLFKDVNDAFGHAAGDEMLKAIAAEMLATTRASDITCRYGGDEFVVVLPTVGSQHALARAENWRVRLAARTARTGGGRVRATVSMGVATFPQHGTTIDEIVAAADRAVYASKSAGSDRVTPAGVKSRAGAGEARF